MELKQIEEITEYGRYTAYGADGHKYRADFVDMGERLNKHFGNGYGIMYFCIPSTIKILGYKKESNEQ